MFADNYRNYLGENRRPNHNIWHTRGKHTRRNYKGLILEIGEYKRVDLITPHYVNQILFF
jgi:hypothetical protein